MFKVFLLSVLLAAQSALARLSTTAGDAQPASDPPAGCEAQAVALCLADPNCVAFGLFDTRIQLHGCTITVPNHDWIIYARQGNTTNFKPLPGPVNVNETACANHPAQMDHTCTVPPPPPSPPPPPPGPKPYAVQGVIDVFTFENSIFYFNHTLYLLENIPCSYWDHAGIWFPQTYGNHSYARVRELNSGRVVANISSSVGFGFLSAFVDYEFDRVWFFGVEADRCVGNGNAKQVWAWQSTDLLHWQRTMVYNFGQLTHNIQVTAVTAPPSPSSAQARANAARRQQALPPHRYAMVLECFNFAINNNADGDLTKGWLLLNGTRAPDAPCGGPALHFNPLDQNFYFLTGGKTVSLVRSADFVSWNTSTVNPFIQPSANDSQVAPFANFSAAAAYKGSPPNAYVGVPEPYPRLPFVPYWRDNMHSWDMNSNDADMCCVQGPMNHSAYFIWGASTQGRPPAAPLDGTDAGTNVVAVTQGKSLNQVLIEAF